MMHRMILSSSRRAAAASLQSTTTTSRGVISTTRFLSSAAAVADDDDVNDGRFSIQGTFREGQASYLDMSSTTPLDPRVLDKMMPYMVSLFRDVVMVNFILPVIYYAHFLCVNIFYRPLNFATH